MSDPTAANLLYTGKVMTLGLIKAPIAFLLTQIGFSAFLTEMVMALSLVMNCHISAICQITLYYSMHLPAY